MEQWSHLPIWRENWLEVFDQGIVVEVTIANWTYPGGGIQYDARFRPDGQNLKRDREYRLRYGAHNLCTRGK